MNYTKFTPNWACADNVKDDIHLAPLSEIEILDRKLAKIREVEVALVEKVHNALWSEKGVMLPTFGKEWEFHMQLLRCSRRKNPTTHIIMELTINAHWNTRNQLVACIVKGVAPVYLGGVALMSGDAGTWAVSTVNMDGKILTAPTEDLAKRLAEGYVSAGVTEHRRSHLDSHYSPAWPGFNPS